MTEFSDPGAAGASGGTTGGFADQAQEKAGEVAAQAQEKAQQAAGQVQDRMREQISQRTATVAERIGAQAEDLQAVGSTLREQGKDEPAQAAERLADLAGRASRYLRERDPDALLADAESFGRRQPWALAAASAAAGFAASRFLKASSRERYRTSAAARPAGPTVERPAGVYAGNGGRANGAPESPSMPAQAAV